MKKPMISLKAQRRIAVALLAAMMLAVIGDLAIAAAQALKPYFKGSDMHQPYRDQAEEALPWMMVNAYDVAFREGPGLNYDVVCSWSYGAAVEVLGMKNGWYEVLHWTCPEPVWVWGEYLQEVNSQWVRP